MRLYLTKPEARSLWLAISAYEIELGEQSIDGIDDPDLDAEYDAIIRVMDKLANLRRDQD